jgi:protease I
MVRALIISADGFEDLELLVPLYRLEEERVDVDIAARKIGPITGKHGYEVVANATVLDTDPDGYDLLVLPGGKAPEALRTDERVLQIARGFFEQEKLVAAICHGPQILLSAGVLEGRTATCADSVAAELKDGGVVYQDSAVVVDGRLITSRRPPDLPAFLREIMRRLRPLLPEE